MKNNRKNYRKKQTVTRLQSKLEDIFGTKYFLPTHQGRASENIISKAYVKEDSLIPMNYHFTTTKAHITVNSGTIEELFIDEALYLDSDHPFKGNIDINKLQDLIATHGTEKISYVR